MKLRSAVSAMGAVVAAFVSLVALHAAPKTVPVNNVDELYKAINDSANEGAQITLEPGYDPSPTNGLFYIPSMEEGANPRYSAIRALDPHTGEQKWEFKRNNAQFNGVLTTASDLLFTGVRGDFGAGPDDRAANLADGHFYAVDARTGQLLWQLGLAGSIQCGPMSYSVGGKQYIAVTAGNTLFAFALPQ